MKIFKVLNTLASSKKEQLSYLIAIGTFPSTDELALEFDDAYQVFFGKIFESQNRDSIIQFFFNKLTKINFIFNEMSNENVDEFWNISSLDNIQWNEIRRLAKEALEYRNTIME